MNIQWRKGRFASAPNATISHYYTCDNGVCQCNCVCGQVSTTSRGNPAKRTRDTMAMAKATGLPPKNQDSREKTGRYVNMRNC